MALQLYNYLSRRKERFESLHDEFVGMYVCGPTVYNHAHIGHAKAYITFDILNRYLRYVGYRVRYVQNITDVGHLTAEGDRREDKIEKQARVEMKEPMEVVEYYTRSFFEDMDALNILRPHIFPRASGHIPEQLELAQTLIDAGYAYQSGNSVYFSVKKWPDFGKLSGRKIDDLVSGARVKVDEGKQDPRDFAVWRGAAPDHLMRWNSPWGEGYPGWHAECTVMAKKYLGLPFDIHGGGLENIFPHNESELIQCEAAYGMPYARYWVLNNMVTVDGTKMGKSLGNSTTLKDVLNAHNPMALRFFLLSSHYRSDTDFSEHALQAAERGYARLEQSILDTYMRTDESHIKLLPADLNLFQPYVHRFLKAMNDDLNTPQALAVLFDVAKLLRTTFSGRQEQHSAALFDEARTFFRIFGESLLGVVSPGQSSQGTTRKISEQKDKLVSLILEVRNAARERRDWHTADMIREKLSDLGIVLEDGKSGTATRARRNSDSR
ncbi:MAG: cysteine--tRNA ligase [Spirochaetales bacterium]|nr:cysteine--tRNA ligase [Spirochaetales bacterium]